MIFVSSGGEANDLAYLASRVNSYYYPFIALRNAYHGVVGASYYMSSIGYYK